MGRLDGKNALVTGGSRGIGRAIALQLARDGARVAFSYRTGEVEAQAVAKEITDLGKEVLMLRADVSNPKEARGLVAKVLERWGRLDILVNNAGITRDKSVRKLSDEEWTEVINTNLNSVYYCSSAAIKSMCDQQYGRIINISSFVGQSGNFGQANYSAAKAGILGLTKTAALELARYGVTVNAVCPGFIDTDMYDKIPENAKEAILKRIPLGRVGKPEEVARCVRYLVEDGQYITGQSISINGGILMP